jgi:hypothetical protein
MLKPIYIAREKRESEDKIAENDCLIIYMLYAPTFKVTRESK